MAILSTSQQPYIDPYIPAVQLLGSPLIAQTIGLNPAQANANTGLTTNTERFVAVYLPVPAKITGAIIVSRVAGSFTANNENSIALFSISAGTITKQAVTANDPTIWQAAANAFKQVAFGTPYFAPAGIYFLGLLYNSSAQTTQPQIAFGTSAGSAVQNAPILSNSTSLSLYLSTAANTQPSSQAASGLSQLSSIPWVGLY